MANQNITYSFLSVLCTLVGPGVACPLGSGAGADKEGITISPNGDINTMTIGADGSVMHSLHGDTSGTATVRLLKTSPTNAILQAAYDFQTNSPPNHGVNTLSLTDARGDVITMQQTAFKKAPDLNYKEDGGVNEWVFDCGRITRLLAGGTTPISN